jgi:hypothetical protein
MCLPTIQQFPQTTRVSIDVDADGMCRFEIVAGDLELMSQVCHVEDLERWWMLHETFARAILPQHGKEVPQGPTPDHWRKASLN